MNLTGMRVALDASTAASATLIVRDGRIHFARRPDPRLPTADLSGHMALPGLINAHDHLEFSLFPRLGKGCYPNASAWARDIYPPQEPPVREHLAVPKAVRLLWGAIKNLASGVTCVAHHNDCSDATFDCRYPMGVVREYGWAHSLEFSPDMRDRFRDTPRGWPFIVHAAEGVDGNAAREIRTLERLGVLGAHTVLVHGIAAAHGDLELIRRGGSAIIWCPVSNLATYGQTLPQAALDCGIPVALGTDSAITTQGDLLDEICIARQSRRVSAAGIYEMVTCGAARILKLNDGRGSLREGAMADLVIVRDAGLTPAETIFVTKPELVMCGGGIRLVSSGLRDRIPGTFPFTFSVESRGTFHTSIDIPCLHRETTRILGSEIRLAGKRVSV